MKLQVLVSAMNQTDMSLVDKMNIQTDAIIVNQCGKTGFENYIDKDNEIKMYSFSERGVGLSRNTALMRASGDICLFADEDLQYVDNYEELVKEAFHQYPNADVIFFNVDVHNSSRKRYQIKQAHKTNFYNSLRYGTYRIAIRRSSIIRENIFFSLLFGGGSRYSCGEDTLFIADCLKHGLNLYAVPTCIATINEVGSTWFNGYTEKYFYDKGVLFASISKNFAHLLCLYSLIRNRDELSDKVDFFSAWKLMHAGIKDKTF